MKFNLRKNCIVCESNMNRRISCGSAKLRRGKHAVTCSRKCAKIYHRIYQMLSQRFSNKSKKKKK